MTGQTLLNYMELVNQELQLQSTETDVTRGLLALNVAQDLFENLAAQVPNFFGGSSGTLATSANTETTAWPSGLLRIDSLHFLDPTTSKPSFRLSKLDQLTDYPVGDTACWLTTSDTATGIPTAYWTNGTSFYWAPLPDGAYTVRYMGMIAQTDITASGTFTYPDAIAFPLAVLAARILKIGVEDQANDLAGIADETVGAVIKTLSNFNRDGGRPLAYTRIHEA